MANLPADVPRDAPAAPARSGTGAPETWILSDGAAGNRRQAQALAQALGVPAREFTVTLGWPWSWLAPRWGLGSSRGLPPEIVAAAKTGAPSLALGCGRRAAAATAWLRAAYGSFAVQILDPRAPPQAWDIVVTPAHDGLRGDNVLNTIGALNAITPARLAAAALQFPALAALPTPRTAVLIGGSTRAQRLDKHWGETLLAYLAPWQARTSGSFLVTTSRRTPAALTAQLRAAFARWSGVFWAPGDDAPNPYPAMLAVAQRIVVSPDSVNLLSEACATGRPVYTHAPRAVHGKLARFHEALLQGGHLRPLRDDATAWQPLPLRETEALAAAVWERYRRQRR